MNIPTQREQFLTFFDLDTFTIFTLVLSFFRGLFVSFYRVFFFELQTFLYSLQKQTSIKHMANVYFYIYLACLSVFLFPINFRTAEPIGPKILMTTRMTLGEIYGRLKCWHLLFLKMYLNEFKHKICENLRWKMETWIATVKS